MEIRKISVDRLLPAKYNPRKDLQPGDPEFEKLKRSVEEFGYVEPIIWNQRTGIVVGGHQRLKVLQHLGYTEVDCVVLDIDEQKEKALNVALNKISGDWDMPLLTALLKDLDESGFDATLTGFDVSEMSDMFDDQSEIVGCWATMSCIAVTAPRPKMWLRSWLERLQTSALPTHLTMLHTRAATARPSRTTICQRNSS